MLNHSLNFRLPLYLTLVFAGTLLALPFFAQAITVGPVRFELKADPGESVSREMTVFNETSQQAAFYPSFEKFISRDGMRNFLPNETSLIGEWTALPDSITLQAGERRRVPFTINVPEDAPPGGHFAVAWWSTAPPDASGGVGIAVRAGVVFHLRVSGEVVEEATVSFKPRKRFYRQTPVNFDIDFQNLGTVHLKPEGEIVIKNIFGRVKSTVGINRNRIDVLPQDSRVFSEIWSDDKFFFGPYRATLSLRYGEDQPKTYQKSRWVLVTPLGGIIGFVIIILIFGYLIPKGVRRYNEKVIERARRANRL